MSIKVEVSWKQDDGSYKCPYCDKIYTYKGISSHIWRSHTDDGVDHKNKTAKIGRTAWNKGLTSENNESVLKMKKTLKSKYENGELIPTFLGRKHKPETILKLKENSGGYRKGSGRGKSGYYKEYWCDSTWELAWVIYHLENSIIFERNSESFKYVYNGEEHKFFPDFIKDGIFYEVKGWMDEQNIAKINQFPHKIEIIDKKEIKVYLEYVINKYGKDFHKLYENRKYEVKKKLCECGNQICKNSSKCSKCYKISIRKVERPSLEDLLKEVEDFGYNGTGRKYGVNGNTIKKWIRNY